MNTFVPAVALAVSALGLGSNVPLQYLQAVEAEIVEGGEKHA